MFEDDEVLAEICRPYTSPPLGTLAKPLRVVCNAFDKMAERSEKSPGLLRIVLRNIIADRLDVGERIREIDEVQEADP